MLQLAEKQDSVSTQNYVDIFQLAPRQSFLTAGFILAGEGKGLKRKIVFFLPKM